MTSQGHPVDVLLVEDSPSDAELTREALAEGKLLNRLYVVNDGEQAIAFLRNDPPYESAPRPGLILLDLNLPRMSGREVLIEIKADKSLRLIPVVVLTTSADDDDIRMAYALNANCYITKPVDLDRFLEAIRELDRFWLEVVTLP